MEQYGDNCCCVEHAGQQAAGTITQWFLWLAAGSFAEMLSAMQSYSGHDDKAEWR